MFAIKKGIELDSGYAEFFQNKQVNLGMRRDS